MIGFLNPAHTDFYNSMFSSNKRKGMPVQTTGAPFSVFWAYGFNIRRCDQYIVFRNFKTKPVLDEFHNSRYNEEVALFQQYAVTFGGGVMDAVMLK